jgi:glyoxylase-like metal-dependent hydrolase (beta-lactamase superfamily II)
MTTASTLTSRHFTLHQLGEGIYAAVATEMGGAMSNSGIVDLGDRALVFDTTMTPQAAEDLRAAAERLTGHQVTDVVNSHWHDDHVSGNQVFENTRIHATVRTREIMAERLPESVRMFQTEAPTHLRALQEQLADESDPRRRAQLRADIALDEEILATAATRRAVLPALAFDTQRTLHGPRRTVELVTYGGGHTDSDACMYLPADGVLFTGDLAVIQTHPWMGHGHPDAWQSILDRLEALDISTLVPGHGPVGDRNSLDFMRCYLVDSQQLAGDLRARESTPEEAAATPMPERYVGLASPEVWSRNLAFLLGARE